MGLLQWFSRGASGTPQVQSLAAVLIDEPAFSPQEVFRRCEALEGLASIGRDAYPALPAIVRALWVEVKVDCRICLRIAAAEAAWKVGGLRDLALPMIAWGLKDEYWGTARKAVGILGEMGLSSHDASPELIHLADRLLESGRLGFDHPDCEQRPLLAEVADALGKCGRGPCWRDAYATLLRIASCKEIAVSDAARAALDFLGNPADGVQEGKPAIASNPFGWGLGRTAGM